MAKKRRGNPFAAEQGPFGAGRAVEDSAELRRILALPRRDWESMYPATKVLDPVTRQWVYTAITQHKATDEQIIHYVPGAKGLLHVFRLEAWLRQPNGTQTLRPIQIAALYEMFYNRGLLMPAAVSAGKTLTSLLGFVVLGSMRPLLLLPATLIDKTHKEAAKYRKDWLIPGLVRMVSYEKLGRADHAHLLEEAEPDVIIADECHRLRNTSAACTKRVKRYLAKRENVVFVGMSGTVMKRSILDFAHLLDWALRAQRNPDGTWHARAPLPTTFEDRMMWSMALDQKRDDDARLAPGALVQFCTPEEREQLQHLRLDGGLSVVRRAVMRRMMDTPGVVATQARELGSSLRVENVRLPFDGPAITAALSGLRDAWTRPDGEPLMDAIELWRHLREVGCGFFYRWNPRPPEVWRERRSAWAAFVRWVLQTNRSGLDSELQVVRAIEAGRYDGQVLKNWREVKGVYNPEHNKEAVWIDTTVVDFAANWLLRRAPEVPASTQGGIVWAEHTEFGQELSRRTGLPLYGEGGNDQTGKRNIEQHPPGEPIIAMIGSNGQGRNLQGWSRSLIASIPQNGARLEQLLGRTHRDGQESDDVIYQFITTIPEQLTSFRRACSDAAALTDMTGQPQKLTYCDIVIDEFGSALRRPKKKS